MRLFEFDDVINASLMGRLADYKHRGVKRIETKALLARLSNIGVSLDIAGLEALKAANPAIANLISNIDDEWVEINHSGEAAMDPMDDMMDLDLDDAMDDGELDDVGMGMDDEGGVTMDQMGQQDPNMMGMDSMNGAPAQAPTNTVAGMAKSALSRRT